MRAVGLKTLKNKLSEYVRLAAGGETVLVTDRDRVVAELVPPQHGRAECLGDVQLAEAVRKGWLTPPSLVSASPLPEATSRAARGTALRACRRSGRALIYLDTSVVLAQLLAEDRVPPPALWNEPIVSSRLLQYEVWTRVHARGLDRSHADDVRQVLGRIALLELTVPVLARALEPFPVPVRTLDALHLASADFLVQQGQEVRLASYDGRMIDAARRLGIMPYAI